MFQFTKEDITKIATALGAEKVSEEKESFRLRVVSAEDKRALSIEIYPHALLGKKRGALVVVYTGASHLQLHNCSGYVISDELGEVTFVSETADRLSGLVIERGAFGSLYSSVNRDLISTDFTQLGVEVMLSGVALSLTEDLLDRPGDKES